MYYRTTTVKKLCRRQTNASTNKNERNLHNSRKHFFNFNAISLFYPTYVHCTVYILTL